MKDLKYYQDKCERLEKVINMRECQLRCACDGLEDFARTGKEGEDADSFIFSLNNINIGVLKNTEEAKQMLKLVGKWVEFNKETLKTAEQKDK